MEKTTQKHWRALQIRLFRMVSIGTVTDWVSRGYDILGSAMLVVNLTVSFLLTFEPVKAEYGAAMNSIESVTVAFFAVDYVLRLMTANCLYPGSGPVKSRLHYMISASGVIDLLSFLPFYLPFFFPAGATAFRMFRVARILRLFRINYYYDSMNVIAEVLLRKKQQLLSSVFIIFVLMLGSSLCMYSVEHPVQPEVFRNAFSGIWWSASTLLTVGYGDIYPITTAGKILSMLITFLGVGMVAIPTGIISAGFVEQYQRLQRLTDYGMELNIRFIEIKISRNDHWAGEQIRNLGLPHGMIVAVIIRGRDTVIPDGKVELRPGDRVIIGAESIRSDHAVELKEVELRKGHPWNGHHISELDISRQSFVVMVKRRGKGIIPKPGTLLCEGDRVILYTRKEEMMDEEDEMVSDPILP